MWLTANSQIYCQVKCFLQDPQEYAQLIIGKYRLSKTITIIGHSVLPITHRLYAIGMSDVWWIDCDVQYGSQYLARVFGALPLTHRGDVRQYTSPSSIQILARRLFGSKALSKSMMTYCLLNQQEQILVKFLSQKYNNLQSNVGQFLSESMW